MQLCTDVKRICTSIKGLKIFKKRGKEMKRSKLEISEPFNFKKEITTLPGLSEDEISVLREQAAAACVGIAEAKNQNNSPGHSHRHHNLQQHRQLPRQPSRRARSASSSPRREPGQYGTGTGTGTSGYVSRPPTSHSAHSLLDYHHAAGGRSMTPTGIPPVSRSYTPVSITGSTRSNRSGNGTPQRQERCGSPMSTMSNRSLMNRLVLPSLTNSATTSGANSDTESPVVVIGSGMGMGTGLGLGGVGGVGNDEDNDNNKKKGGLGLQLDYSKLEIAMPVSPVSSLGSTDDLDDPDNKFFIGSPVSPLTPRGSPKSNRDRVRA